MSEESGVHSFGIASETGKPLNDLTDEVIEALLQDESRRSSPSDPHSPSDSVTGALQARNEQVERSFALEDQGDTDPNNLAQAGWGILFAPGVDPKIKEALQPLIDHRRREGAAPLVIFDQDGYRPGENVFNWLKRHNASLDVVNPAAGVPYYLLIVAPPQTISFEFQYVLDLYWAVGRLWFETPAEFQRYAESVVAYEKAERIATTRQVALFAPEHEFDTATQLFTREVALPLRDGQEQRTLPLGASLKYQLRAFLGTKATKQTLTSVFQGSIDGGPPAFLLSGGHGMQFPNGDPLQISTQGALVCQDWDRLGRIMPKDWFAAADVPPDAKIHGLIHFMFACHGGGVPQFDNFDRSNKAPRQIAPGPFFSKLPQTMLAHPNGGALAVLAHIERAWSYSFEGDGGIAQVQGFRNVATRILKGDRIGEATDTFNVKWAGLSARLLEAQSDRVANPSLPLGPIGKLWIARDDARNFMILGDPAVRLRVALMAQMA